MQLATFLGGPLASVYILAENFRLLGYPQKVQRTWIRGVFVCGVFIVGAVILTSSSKSPSFLIPLISILVGTAIMQSWQGEDIQQHINSGGPVYPVWRAVVIGLVSLVTTFLSLTILLIILNNFFDLGLIPKKSK